MLPSTENIQFKLHHIGQLVADIKGSGKELCERFGYVSESEVIKDPVQTAYVQFFRLPGEKHWLELISPVDEKSKLTLSLKKGITLHHLCYEVENIQKACEFLRERKLFMLSAPISATAFDRREIAWFMSSDRSLIELVEAGVGALSLKTINNNH